MERRRAHQSLTFVAAVAAVHAVVMVAGGCDGCGAPPVDEAPEDVADLRIPVTSDGEKITVIDRSALAVITHAATSTDAESSSIPIFVDGDRHGDWDMAALSRVERLRDQPEDGEGDRPAWSLRPLKRTLLGPDYRATEVMGPGPVRESPWSSEVSDELREISSVRFERTP
jgi:hypothetical protein